MLDFKDFPETWECLNEYATELMSRYKSSLESDARIATGDLINTLNFRIQISGSVFQVIFEAQDYWKYIENGRGPGPVPREKILDWIRIKKILPQPGPNGKIPTEESLAFLIARKISREGFKGGNYLEKNNNDCKQEFMGKIVEAIKKDFTNFILEHPLFKKFN